MAIKIKLSQYDNGIKLVFVIKKDGMIEPLNGAEVRLKFQEQNTGRTINRLCTITDATSAECEYVLTSEDLSVTGAYITELETRFANGSILSVDNPIILTVTPEYIEYNSGRVRRA